MDTPQVNTKTTCMECGDHLYLHRYDMSAKPPFPSNWWFDVVHDHTPEPPVWVAALYYREPKGRFPAIVKDIRGEQKEQRKRVITARREANSAKPGTKNRSN